MTANQIILNRALRKAEQVRAKARRQRDIIAAMHIDGDARATLELVAAATLAATRADRAVSEARSALIATVRA